jgi:hypothetical protein
MIGCTVADRRATTHRGAEGREARTEDTEPPGETYRRVDVGRIGE